MNPKAKPIIVVNCPHSKIDLIIAKDKELKKNNVGKYLFKFFILTYSSRKREEKRAVNAQNMKTIM